MSTQQGGIKSVSPSGNVKCQNFWESDRREGGGDIREGQAAPAAGKLPEASNEYPGGRSLRN